MNCTRIAVIDSGVGGLSLLDDLVKEFPFCEFLYFGDNQNAPYGNRTYRDLFSLTLENLSFVLSFNVDAVVFACNTISVSILPKIREFSPVQTFGIFPPVEKELMKNNRVLLLSTDVTARRFNGIKGVETIGLSRLVKAIETNLFSLSSINISSFLPSKKIFFDTLILGCTHFNFVKSQISNHFCPRKVTSGSDSVINQLKLFLRNRKSLDKNCCFSVKFIGKSREINQDFWTCLHGVK